MMPTRAVLRLYASFIQVWPLFRSRNCRPKESYPAIYCVVFDFCARLQTLMSLSQSQQGLEQQDLPWSCEAPWSGLVYTLPALVWKLTLCKATRLATTT